MARTLADRGDAEPERIITTFLDHEVEFVIIGGVAALVHGVQRITRDIDLLIEPSKVNCRRAIEALVELEAEEYRPGSGRWVPISPRADPGWLLQEPRLCDSGAGGVDICNAIEGVPDWRSARAGAIEIEAFDHPFLVLGKDILIKSKLAAGREQDKADVAELNEL